VGAYQGLTTMIIQFKEGNKYKLQADYYESILLECTYVEDNKAYFKLQSNNDNLGFSLANYRLDIKSKKLHKWNSNFWSWDNIENTLSEYTADDIWSKKIGNGGGGGYYSGIGQGD
jgi:hypothetical protein